MAHIICSDRCGPVPHGVRRRRGRLHAGQRVPGAVLAATRAHAHAGPLPPVRIYSLSLPFYLPLPPSSSLSLPLSLTYTHPYRIYTKLIAPKQYMQQQWCIIYLEFVLTNELGEIRCILLHDASLLSGLD